MVIWCTTTSSQARTTSATTSANLQRQVCRDTHTHRDTHTSALTHTHPPRADRVSYQLVTPSVPDEVDSPELVGQLFTYLASGLASDRPQGVEVGVATEVALGSVVVPHWINDASENDDYITRRWVGGGRGVSGKFSFRSHNSLCVGKF